MRILVCGGRDFSDTTLLYNTLDKIAKYEYIDAIIEGDAPGADRIAGQWAKRNRIDLYLFKPDWDRYGKAAGPIRNQEMIDKGKPDLVIAFAGGKGTADMVRRARAAGLPVEEVQCKPIAAPR